MSDYVLNWSPPKWTLRQRPETEEEEPTAIRRVKTEVYSRVVGYIRPVESWGIGKVQEFADRVTYDVEEEVNEQPAAES